MIRRGLLLPLAVGMLALAACDAPPSAPRTSIAPSPPVIEEPTTITNSHEVPLAVAIEPEGGHKIPTDIPAPRPSLHITWALAFEYLEDMEEYADFVVVATVMNVDYADYPSVTHSRVQLRLNEDWSHSPIGSDDILVIQFGGSPTYYDEDSPPYVVGEEYLLFLRRHRERRGEVNPKFADPPRYSALPPYGRYRIEDSRVESVSGYTVKNGPHGSSVREARRLVSAAQTICWREDAKVASSVTPGAQQFESIEGMEIAADAIVLASVEDVAEGRVEEGSPFERGTHFTDVHLRVIEDLGRHKLESDRLVLEQLGGKSTTFSLEDRPYCVGEEYLLFLRQQVDNDGRTYVEPPRYASIGSGGRYRIRDDRLKALTTAYPLNRRLDGHSLETVRRIVSMLQATASNALAGTTAAQGHLMYYGLEDLERDSEFIVVAEAVRTISSEETAPQSPRGTRRLLRVHLQIRQDWSRSRIPSGSIVMEQPDDTTGHEFPEYRRFGTGDDYLLFIRRQVRTDPETGAESTVYSLLGPQGRYRVGNGKLEAPRFPVYQLGRELDGQTLESVEARIAELRAAPDYQPTPGLTPK